MAQATWEKPASSVPLTRRSSGERLKFLIGGVLLLGAVAYLVISGTLSGARYFITVDEVVHDTTYVGQTVRLTGAVIGETIQYDAENLIIEFTIAHVPQQVDDLAEALHAAVNDTTATQLRVRVENQVKPDLLRHEAQAILTGTLGPDGVFHATELNLKCPTRFTENGPDSSIAADPEV